MQRGMENGGSGGVAVVAAASKTERKSASESRFESHGVVIACRAIARLRGTSEGRQGGTRWGKPSVARTG